MMMPPSACLLADIALPRVVEQPLGPNFSNPVGALLTFAAIFLIEAVLLRLLRWGGWGRVCVVSFVINLVTTLLGVVLAGIGRSLPWPLWLAITFLLTVLIEGGLLKIFQPAATFVRALVVSLIINAASYALLSLLVFFFARPSPRPPPYHPHYRPEPTPTPP